MINCSVCIATYKRPKLLDELLTSLINQNLTENIKIEIIVVDNDSQTSAKNICTNFRHNNISLKYFIQPQKNIALTRNKAVKEATGEYILFIDDDEKASPDWIINLSNTLISYQADAVFGRVISYFKNKVPNWLKETYIYNRPSPATGSSPLFTSTNNCMIKSSLIKNMEGPFEAEYGLTGGSDSKLFAILTNKGAKFVSCYEAWVSEEIPAERTKLGYLIKRVFRTGNNHTRILIELAGKNKRKIQIKEFFISLCYMSIGLFLAFITIFNKKWRFHWMLKSVSNLGRFFAVLKYYPIAYK